MAFLMTFLVTLAPRVIRWVGLYAVLGSVAFSANAMSAGYADRFDDGTTMGWGGNAAATFVSDGGPQGVGDGYLSFSTVDFHLGTRNQSASWTGDWLTAGITSLEMDLQASDNYAFRLVLIGDGGMWSTATPVPVLANLGWQSLRFDLTTDAMVHLSEGMGGQFVVGTGVLDDTLANVSTVLIRHDPAPTPTQAGSHPEHVTGSAGLDNITAVGAVAERSADFNGDGIVNLLDLDILGTHWEITNATPDQGDANGDGNVNLLDLDLLGTQWEDSSAFATALSDRGIAVPEPISLSVAAIGGVLLLTRRPH